MFRHVSQSGQTLGNISEKHRETSNVSEFARKHFCFSGSKFCFRNNVSTGGQTGKHLRIHRESQMFPQQCFLVCPGLNHPAIQKHYWHSREAQIEPLLFECAFGIEALRPDSTSAFSRRNANYFACFF